MQPDASPIALGLYEALLDGDGLLPALRRLAERVGASSHAVHMIRYREGRPVGSISAGEGGLAGAPLQDYARYWVRHDPWAKATAALPLEPVNIASAVPPEALRRSRIWNEWGKPHDGAFHMLAVPLLRQGESTGGMFFHRREREEPFDKGELALLEALFPHLRRIFAAEAMFAVARETPGPILRAGLDALPDGVALLDSERRLVFVNAALRAMVAEADGLGIGRSGLESPEPAVQLALSRALTAALAAADGRVGMLPVAGCLAVPRRSGRAPWMVRALPVPSRAEAAMLSGFRGAILLITDGEKRSRPAAALLSQLFNLTAAEAALAASLAAGRSPDEHAARRRVSRETVRTQLAAIRRKTGCRRQADMLALFARLPG